MNRDSTGIISAAPAGRQRRQVTGILWGIALGCLLLVFVGLLPLQRRAAGLEQRIEQRERELADFRRQHCVPPLSQQLRRAVGRNSGLQRRWEWLRALVDTFKGQSPLAEGLSADEQSRIDFKVALFEARTRLKEQAEARGVLPLPADLGMEEKIGTDEPAETRLWQLAAVVKLVEQGVALGIPEVEEVTPLPPLPHRLPEEEQTLCREFPVRITLRCPFRLLTVFLDTILQDGKFFAVRRFHAERVSVADEEPLRVTLVCGAQLFQLRGESSEPFRDGRGVERRPVMRRAR